MQPPPSGARAPWCSFPDSAFAEPDETPPAISASLVAMKTSIMRLVVPLLVLGPLAAQDYYPHHNFTFGAGAMRPRGDLGPVLDDSPGVSVGYGYRFLRYLQADISVDILFGAAGIRDFLSTGIGDYRIKDREYFLPFGGRAIAPLFGGRLLISGGGAWLKYHERVNQPGSDFRVDCPVCAARSGWGYYALANASYFVESGKHIRIGATTRVMRGHTDGDPLGYVPGFQTKDHWLSIGAEFGLSF